MNDLDHSKIQNIIKAISLIRKKIQWKPYKAESHLAKRIKLGHLPNNSSLHSYERIIKEIIFNPESEVYVFWDNDFIYPTITSIIKGKIWLVMFSLDGVMETAFPPSNPQKYLDNNPFIYIGSLKEFF
jgi:hypothetical protein